MNNNNVMNRFDRGFNAMLSLNPRIGSGFNDTFTPATYNGRVGSNPFGHGRGSLYFGSAFNSTNPITLNSAPSLRRANDFNGNDFDAFKFDDAAEGARVAQCKTLENLHTSEEKVKSDK